MPLERRQSSGEGSRPGSNAGSKPPPHGTTHSVTPARGEESKAQAPHRDQREQTRQARRREEREATERSKGGPGPISPAAPAWGGEMGGGMSGGMGWREGGGGLGEGMSVSAAFGREMLEAMTAWGRAGGEAGGDEAGGGGTSRGPNEPQSPCCWGAAATPSASTLGAGPPRVEGGDPRHNLNQRRVRWGPAVQGKQPFHTPAAPAAEPATAAAATAAAAMPLPLRQKSEARPTPAAAAPATAAVPPPPRSLLLLLASTSELRQAARNALGSGCLAELARASTHAPRPLTRAVNPTDPSHAS